MSQDCSSMGPNYPMPGVLTQSDQGEEEEEGDSPHVAGSFTNSGGQGALALLSSCSGHLLQY